MGRYLPNKTSRVAAHAVGDDMTKDLEKVLEIILFRAECAAFSSNVKIFSVLLRINFFIPSPRVAWCRGLLVYGKSIEIESRFGKTALIYLLYPIVKGIDAEKAWAQKNCSPQLHVLVVNRPILVVCPSHPVDPNRAEPT